MTDTPAQRERDVAKKLDNVYTVAGMSLPAKDKDSFCSMQQALVNVFLSL